MTRKDFELIAASLRNSSASPETVQAMADTLATTNPRLDRARFIKAASPVQMKTVRNLMSGKEIEIAADTPLSCDPSSETYWSM